MNSEAITLITKSVITIATILITTFVIPWLRSVIDENKLVKVEEYTKFAVRCAEQLFTIEEFAQKKSYVMTYVTNKVEEFGIDLTIEDINNIIESTVNEIKRG